MLDWIAESILSIANFVPPLFSSDETQFKLVRSMFALLLIVLLVYIIAMTPFRSLFARLTNKLHGPKK